MLVIPGLPSYDRVEVYYLKGVIGLPIVISFVTGDIIFFFGNGLIDESSSLAGPIQISEFPEPCLYTLKCVSIGTGKNN